MKVHIYGSSSKGNCVGIFTQHNGKPYNMLIDAGLSYKTFVNNGGSLDAYHILIITHHHGDHFNLPFIRKWLTTKKPIVVTEKMIRLLEKEGKIDVAHHRGQYQYHPYQSPIITTHPQKHGDIVNYSVHIHSDNETALYATDLDSLDKTDIGVGILWVEPVDVLLLEGNYDEEWLREYIISAMNVVNPESSVEEWSNDELDEYIHTHYKQIPKELSSGLFRAVQNRRHLSKQQARLYASTHLKPNGVYYELHRSSMFYERPEKSIM